ncbi:MAG TPA: type II toxin-antitoxin system VapC family toxin [Gemmatimonadaceae bacterium]|nr:type II toxin-antitoxin system VapC family toxin [Gemmatimonadaceae bacterium]
MIPPAETRPLEPGTPVLVDTNVLMDIFTEDPIWSPWSEQALAEAGDHTVLVLNQIVYAELSVSFPTVEALDEALPLDRYRRESLPWEAGFVAGKAYLAYRRRGGPRRSPLPDFYIGAHAAVRGYTLLTRDATRYRTYFPRLRLLAPDGDAA